MSIQTVIKKTLQGETRSGGLTGYVTWERLAREGLLLTAREKELGKKIVQFEADADGIKFIIE